MHGWFKKLFQPSVSLVSQSGSVSSLSYSSSSSPPSSSSSSSSSTSTEPKKPPSALSSELRWSRKYDLLVCHSVADCDIEEAKLLVAFLEDPARSLRCFLWQRDVCPGSPVFTEFCEAVQESHMQALLITPHFLQEEWCMYMMHQALAEGPMSKRLIPLIQNLGHDECPTELKFFYYINLSSNGEQAYGRINRAVLLYLENLIISERTRERSRDNSHTGISGGGSR